jgi:U2 small nuclear ribonucleoprotein B''
MDGSYTPRQKRKREETKTMEERQHVPSQAHAQPKVVKLIVNNIPNNVLFAQALPEEITQELLTNLFRPYAGFMEVRMVPSRKDIAFIDFLDEMSANMALQALNGYKITPADALHLTYAKK